MLNQKQEQLRAVTATLPGLAPREQLFTATGVDLCVTQLMFGSNEEEEDSLDPKSQTLSLRLPNPQP